MSDVQASFQATDTAFHVEGYEKIEYDLLYVQGAFAAENREIADSFRRFGRCLMIIDEGVHELYGESIEDYFFHHGTELRAVPVRIALLEAHGEELPHTGFGHREGSTSLREVDHEVTYEAIRSSSRRKSRCCTADRQLLLRQ